MFGIEPSEFLLVGIVALVVIGPKDLPRAMRVVGQWVGRARGMARHFRSGFDEMVRQAELEEMEKRWAAENARIMAEHPNPAPEALSGPPPEEAHDAEFARPLPSPAESVEQPASLPVPEEPAPAPEPKAPARARKPARKAEEPATAAAPDDAPPADQPGLPFGTSEKPADRG